MTAIIQKYKVLFLILGAVALATLLWFVINRQNTEKIPTKGVFVLADGVCFHGHSSWNKTGAYV